MKILATIDFSTTSESVLKNTAAYAKLMDAEVFLIHTEPANLDIDLEEQDLTQETVRLKKNAQALEKVGVKVTPLFLQGPVCETILEEAKRIGANLIIVGAHGHGGAHCKVPVGHISECILLRARIPVLIIPSER